MPKTLIFPHAIPIHWDQNDAPFLARTNPPWIKIVTDGIEVPHVNEMCAAAPNAQIIVRNYPQSELWDNRGLAWPGARAIRADFPATLQDFEGGEGSGRDLGRDIETPGNRAALMTPEEAAAKQVEIAIQMADRLRSQGINLDRVWFEGLNEARLWSDEPPEAVARLERTRVLAMRKAGLKSVVGNFGVGWPGNGGIQDAPVQWDFFRPVIEAWGPDVLLGLHEYWYLDSPKTNWRWWAGRFTQCPYGVPIVITEAGIDCGVVPGQAGSGWMRLPQPAMRDKARQYVSELAWYEEQCLKDARVQGIAVFTRDGVGAHWGGFNTKLSDWEIEFEAWLATRPELTTPPPVVVPQPETDARAALLAKADAAQVIQFNPNAALQKRIFADGFVPNSGEFEYGPYIAQRAENLKTGAVRVYHCIKGQWDKVSFYAR